MLGEEDDASVVGRVRLGFDEGEEIVVEREEYPVSFGRVGEMFVVRIAECVLFERRPDVSPPSSQSLGDWLPNVLVGVYHASVSVSASVSGFTPRNSSMWP